MRRNSSFLNRVPLSDTLFKVPWHAIFFLWFNLDFRESNPKFPQFLLNHGRDNPHYEITPTTSLVEIPETSENPTHYSLFTTSRTVIQIKN